MSALGYQQMSNVAAHAGGQQARRENFGMRRAPPRPACGPSEDMDSGCHFPAPHPMRVYCQPAAFHRTCGEPYHLLSLAYGASRPLERYY